MATTPAATETLKVSVILTLDVDRQEWDRAYGTSDNAARVRDDVKSYVVGLVRDSAAAQEGGIVDVTQRGGSAPR
jgi:hypothetical protein